MNAVISSSPINLNTSTAATGAINIGNASILTSIKGPLTATIGVKTPYVESTLASTALELAAAQTGGILYIGTGPRTSGGEINIGTGANLANNLYIGHKGATVSTQVVRINTSTGAGVGSTVIGSATSGTNIIGNAGVGGNLTVTGSITASDLITANGGLTLNAGDLLTATGGIKSLDYDVSIVGSDFQIAKSQTTGAMYIGHAQTSGPLNIGCGTARIAGGDINIGTNGSASSVGNVNIGYAGSSAIAPPSSVQLNGLVKLTGSLFTGVLSGTTGILAGRSGYLAGGTATLNQTVMNSSYFYIVNTASSTITLPAPPTTFQIITIKSIVNTTITIAGNGRNMWITGATFAGSYTLPIYGLLTLYYGGTDWYQI